MKKRTRGIEISLPAGVRANADSMTAFAGLSEGTGR